MVLPLVVVLGRLVGLRHRPFAELMPEQRERDGAVFPGDGAERHTLAEDVVRDDLLLTDRGGEELPLLGEALALLHVELVLVAQAAHDAATGAGDLPGVERREALILRGARLHGIELGEPGARAEGATAAAHAIEALGLVAHPDMPHVHPGREAPLHLPHQIAEVDALLSGEVDGEPPSIPLPFGVGDLHLELQLSHELDRGAAHRVLVGAEPDRGVDLLRGGEPNDRG